MEKIVIPNPEEYPLRPNDISSKLPLSITFEHLLDHYLSQLARFCAASQSFSFPRNEFWEFLKKENQTFCGSMERKKRLQEDDLVYVIGEVIFLTHTFAVKAVNISRKIMLQHIQFDDIPGKTVMEQVNAKRFSAIKKLVLHAQEVDSLGPFDPEEFPGSYDMPNLVRKTQAGLMLTSVLLTEFFRYYPAPKYVQKMGKPEKAYSIYA